MKACSHLDGVANTAAEFRDGGQVQLAQVMVMRQRGRLAPAVSHLNSIAPTWANET